MLRKLTGLGAFFSALVLVASLAPGCGSDDKAPIDEAAPDKYPTRDSFCDAVAKAECNDNVLSACGLPKDASPCLSEVASLCRNGGAKGITEGRDTSNYRKDKAESCVDAVKTAYSKSSVSAADNKAIVDACAPVFSTRSADGGSCTYDADCSNAASKCVYVVEGDAYKLRCQQAVEKGLGQDCTTPGVVCPKGAFCLKNDAVGKYICAERQKAGDMCTAERPPVSVIPVPCDEALLCSNIDATTNKGACGGRLGRGTACKEDAECETGNFCAQVGAARVCLEQLSFSFGADSCKSFDGQP